MTKEIENIDDIQNMVDSFYEKVRKDELLGSIFNSVIQDKWDIHLKKMYTFWETVLLDEHTYYGSPFPPHAKLPVEKKHFDRWISLFISTVNELFNGVKADEAVHRATNMAKMFQYKIDYLKDNKVPSIL